MFEPAPSCAGDREVTDGVGFGLLTLPPLPPPLPPQESVNAIAATIKKTGVLRRLTPGVAVKERPKIMNIAVHRIFKCSLAMRRICICPSGVVVIVKVVEPEPSTTVVGLKLQVVSAGRPEQLKLLTADANPFCGNTLTDRVCELPCDTVTCEEPGVSEKSVT